MTTIHEMLLRRRVLGGPAGRPGPMPAPRHPHGIELEYTSWLLALSREMNGAIKALLSRHGVRFDADQVTLLPGQVKRLVEEMRGRLQHMAGRDQLVGKLDQIAARVGTFSREQWAAQVKAALGVDLRSDPNLAPLFARFREQNVSLISSLAEDKVTRVQSVLESARPETRVEDLADQIREQTGATDSRAALIARDQTLSLNAQVTRARHEAAGITQYRWSTSHDVAVRPGHRALDGQVFEYAAPPVVDPDTGETGNPGEPINCRCLGIPIIPDVDDQ
jgi:SPP1 gp7 family putative phage head morphogenesis protein